MPNKSFDDLMREHYKLANEFRKLHNAMNELLNDFRRENVSARDWPIRKMRQLSKEKIITGQSTEEKSTI